MKTPRIEVKIQETGEVLSYHKLEDVWSDPYLKGKEILATLYPREDEAIKGFNVNDDEFRAISNENA